MKEATWKQELLWVARNEHGVIVRVSEVAPSEWGKKSEGDDRNGKVSEKASCD